MLREWGASYRGDGQLGQVVVVSQRSRCYQSLFCWIDGKKLVGASHIYRDTGILNQYTRMVVEALSVSGWDTKR